MGLYPLQNEDHTATWPRIVGQLDHLAYALQGNILSGPCVVPAIEQAILNTPGDVPEKLVQEVIDRLQEHGTCEVEESELVHEDVHFRLPAEIG